MLQSRTIKLLPILVLLVVAALVITNEVAGIGGSTSDSSSFAFENHRHLKGFDKWLGAGNGGSGGSNNNNVPDEMQQQGRLHNLGSIRTMVVIPEIIFHIEKDHGQRQQ